MGLFFYEDMLRDPARFLLQIYRFLGVNPNWQAPRLHRVSNPGGERDPALPKPLAERWHERYAPVVQAVKATVGRVPESWDKPPGN